MAADTHEHKSHFRAFFTRRALVRLAISVFVSMLLGAVIDLAHKGDELSTFRARAYISIAQFAPWNIAQRYISIVFTQGNSDAEQFAERQEQQSFVFRGSACNLRRNYSSSGSDSGGQNDPCAPTEHPHGIRAFYVSAHVPAVLRPLTAFFDLLVHALFDQGIIGFLVAAIQVIIGALLTRYAIRSFKIEMDTFVSYVVGVPFGILLLGSVAAIPLWLLALAGMMVLKSLPAAGLGAQAGGTAWLVSSVVNKTAELVVEDAIKKQVERVVLDQLD